MVADIGQSNAHTTLQLSDEPERKS